MPTPREAIARQQELRHRVVRERDFGRVRHVAGVDISVREERALAAVVVLSWPSLEAVEVGTANLPITFPYVPGLLSFRELPSILEAFSKLRQRPDLLFVDGHGLAHPRRFGVACHLGVTLDLPAIGCGKSRLCGEETLPADRRGSRRLLRHQGEKVGALLRTRLGVKPLYVSIGHRIDLDTALRYVLRATPRFRLPEPIRAAHRAAGAITP